MLSKLRRSACRFAEDESGNMTIFSLFMVMMMVMVGGIGVDLMANEMERVKRQNAIDRAALAAANLNQTKPAAEIFADYMAKAGYDGQFQNLRVQEEPGIRTVSAQGNERMKTRFMRLVGQDTLPLYVRTKATQKLEAMEVSLVLDISGSMRFDGRIASMRTAAASFIDIVLSDELQDVATVNLVPYAGQVNVGETMFQRIGGVRRLVNDPNAGTADENVAQNSSNGQSCVELTETDFEYAELPKRGPYNEVANFMMWAMDWPTMNWGWCPSGVESIKYASNKRDALKTTINTMRLADGTGTQYAMKYGLALLDPSSQDDFQALRLAGELGSDHTNRPAPYGVGKKYIVLMTDGGVSPQFRPVDPYDPRNADTELQFNTSNKESYRGTSDNFQDFLDVCELAKQSHREIIVYTIAMESSSADNMMRQCASSPSHFYKVSSSTIEDAFVSIGNALARDALGLVE